MKEITIGVEEYVALLEVKVRVSILKEKTFSKKYIDNEDIKVIMGWPKGVEE